MGLEGIVHQAAAEGDEGAPLLAAKLPGKERADETAYDGPAEVEKMPRDIKEITAVPVGAAQPPHHVGGLQEHPLVTEVPGGAQARQPATDDQNSTAHAVFNPPFLLPWIGEKWPG
jgi:hypothetical protein